MKPFPLKTLATGAIAALLSQLAIAVPVAPPGDLATWTATGTWGSAGADGDITLSPLGNARYGYVSTANSEAFGVSPLSLPSNNKGFETNVSTIVSGSFSAGAADRLSMFFNYVSTDGKGYDDYAWARLVNADTNALVTWLFTARSTNSGPKNVVPGDVLDNSVFDPKDVIVNFKDRNFTDKTVNWSPLGFSNNQCWEENAPGCGFTGWMESGYTFAQGGNFKVEIGVTNWGDTAYDSGLAFDFANLTHTQAASPAPVPEPETYALMLAGLGLLAIVRRRRK